MPYARKAVPEEPAGGEPVAAAAVVTALTAFLIQYAGLDSQTAETVVIGVVGLVATIFARRSVTPVRK